MWIAGPFQFIQFIFMRKNASSIWIKSTTAHFVLRNCCLKYVFTNVWPDFLTIKSYLIV